METPCSFLPRRPSLSPAGARPKWHAIYTNRNRRRTTAGMLNGQPELLRGILETDGPVYLAGLVPGEASNRLATASGDPGSSKNTRGEETLESGIASCSYEIGPPKENISDEARRVETRGGRPGRESRPSGPTDVLSETCHETCVEPRRVELVRSLKSGRSV